MLYQSDFTMFLSAHLFSLNNNIFSHNPMYSEKEMVDPKSGILIGARFLNFHHRILMGRAMRLTSLHYGK